MTWCDAAPHAVPQTLHKANEALYEKLMDLEISSSERYAESIKAFESNYDELTKRTLEQMAAFFGKLRDLESEYHEKIINLGTEALEKGAAQHTPRTLRTSRMFRTLRTLRASQARDGGRRAANRSTFTPSRNFTPSPLTRHPLLL